MDYKVGFYPLTTLNQLVNLKDPIPKMKKPGIYHLECGECSAQYIGQTGRPLSKRLGEHRTAFNKNAPQDSAMARHSLERHHDFSKVNITLVRQCLKGSIMHKAEEVETIASYKTIQQDLLNDLQCIFVTPFIRHYFDYNPCNLP